MNLACGPLGHALCSYGQYWWQCILRNALRLDTYKNKCSLKCLQFTSVHHYINHLWDVVIAIISRKLVISHK